jgi:hypothetical protein
MKKLSVALAVALAFAAVAPAMAAPAVALTGSLETKFTSRASSVQNETFLSLQAGLQGGSDKTKAVVILAPWSKPDSMYTSSLNSNATSVVDPRIGSVGSQPAGTTFQNPSDPTKFNAYGQDFSNMIKSMYLQTTGSFWTGGPEATTTIGSVAVSESPFVGDLGNRRGIKVEGLKLGPLGVEAFYAPAGGTARVLNFDQYSQNPQTKVSNVDNVSGVKLGAKIAGIDLGANIVRSDENKPEMAITGAMMPAKNLALDGYVVRDRATNQVARINGAYAVNPALTLNASYRKADESINPMYPTRYDADGNGIITTDEWVASVNNRLFQAFDNKTGAMVGADLRLAGVHVNGSYDLATSSTAPDHVAKVAADTALAGFKLNGGVKYVGSELNDLTWSAQRDFQLAGLKIHGAYDGERAQVVGSVYRTSHEVKASTILDMIQPLKGIAVDVRGKVYSDSTPRELEANATYQAPNGMVFGLHRLVDASHMEGDTSVTSGLKVTF